MKRAIAVMVVAGLFAGGCVKYYKVTDPTTGTMYYTTELKKNGAGAATLKDAKTGNTVTIQNSEISEVNKEQYEAGRFAPPPEPEKPAEKPASNPFQ